MCGHVGIHGGVDVRLYSCTGDKTQFSHTDGLPYFLITISSLEFAFRLVSTKNADSGHFQFMHSRSEAPLL